mmetsp:Transcript_25697/g.43052  ORF Transcript_25697/g.43052 Transcript_25697/m.43052 type:complete len:240 (+) Transcript_25697:358-1077(+)
MDTIFSTWKKRPKFPYDVNLLPFRLERLLAKTKFHANPPKMILDVGANAGTWTTEIRAIFPSAQFFMVEAASKHDRTLRQVGAPYAFAVLGDAEKEVDFYEQKTSTGNSLFREVSTAFAKVAPTKRRMRTLDNLLAENNVTGPYGLLKIDTQGAEILVLKGADRTLSLTKLILLELSIIEFNKGAPRAAEVVAFLAARGFAPYDITELHYLPNGQLFQFDMIFARLESVLLNPTVSKFF